MACSEESVASVEAACIACAATLAVVSPDETFILWKLNDRSATTANSVAASERRRTAGPVIMWFCTKPRLLSSHEHVLVISSGEYCALLDTPVVGALKRGERF